jgi:hypothetical protein
MASLSPASRALAVSADDCHVCSVIHDCALTTLCTRMAAWVARRGCSIDLRWPCVTPCLSAHKATC